MIFIVLSLSPIYFEYDCPFNGYQNKNKKLRLTNSPGPLIKIGTWLRFCGDICITNLALENQTYKT